MQTVSGVKQNLWRRRGSGLYAPNRMNFPIDGLVLYLPLWEPSQASLLNGTGIATGAPVVLVGPVAQTIVVTQAGTFLIYLPKGATGTTTAGTMAVTGSPVSLVGGLNTITTTGAVGNFTVAVPKLISKDLNAHVCTVTGAIWTPQGRWFDGDDWIGCGNILNFERTDPFTVLVWYKQVASGVGAWIVTKMLGSGTYRGWGIQLTGSNNLRVVIRSDQTTANMIWKTSTPTYVNVGSHFQFGFTYDGSSLASGITLYANGLPVAAAADYDALSDTMVHTGGLNLNGRGDGSSLTSMGIGEAGVYNRALSVLEIQQIYLVTKWRYR